MEHKSGHVSAVVLAGRANTGKLQNCTPEEWEALIEVGGRPMLSWVIDALKGSRSIGGIFLVAPESPFAALYEGNSVQVVKPQDSMVRNALAGCHAAPDTEFILVATSDVPFITPDVVDRFIEQCLNTEADFYYPVVPREITEKRFPGVVRTYASLREGTFTGGNMVLIRKSLADLAAERANVFVENRKSPLKQAGLLGWSFVIKLLLRTLSIAELEHTISRYFGMRCRAVIAVDPEIGVDVDKPADLELARRDLRRPA